MGVHYTIILLALMGIIWMALICVLFRFVSRNYAGSRHWSRFAQGVAVLGFLSLFYEYWVFFDFRHECELEAGFTRNEPVNTASLKVQVFPFMEHHALMNGKIDKLYVDASEGMERALYFDRGMTPLEAEDGCSEKQVYFSDGSSFPTFRQDEFTKHKICLEHVDLMEEPRYLMRLEYNKWTSGYWGADSLARIQDSSIDYRLQLVDTATDEVTSEFASKGRDMGPLMTLVLKRWYQPRYTCPDAIFGFKHHQLGERFKRFLEVAIK